MIQYVLSLRGNIPHIIFLFTGSPFYFISYKKDFSNDFVSEELIYALVALGAKIPLTIAFQSIHMNITTTQREIYWKIRQIKIQLFQVQA